MKKQTVRVISLNKQTIAHLSDSDLNAAKGGTALYTCSGCGTYESDCFCKYTVTYSCDCVITS